jgi:rfaE bifunctional protein nucleotidyltransferase chain/domain
MYLDRDSNFFIILKQWASLIRWRSMIKLEHPNARVVSTNGCFDILHAGHIHMLKKAASYGDFLIVGLNGDSSIRALKGPKRPINNEQNRKIVLESIRYVDFVHIFYTQRANIFLQVAEPHIYIKSKDYNLNNMDPSEKAILNKLGTKIEFIDIVRGLSTTNIIKKCE